MFRADGWQLSCDGTLLMVSVGQHLQVQNGGICLFPVQLYPLTLVFAVSNLVSFPAESSAVTETDLSHHPFMTITPLSAECTTWLASRTHWASLVPCEMTFRWCKDLGNNTGLWEQFVISQLWVMQRCVGCDQLQTGIPGSLIQCSFLSSWLDGNTDPLLWKFCLVRRLVTLLTIGVSPFKHSWCCRD